jgi:hypothetical protein
VVRSWVKKMGRHDESCGGKTLGKGINLRYIQRLADKARHGDTHL